MAGIEPALQRNAILSRTRLPIPPHRLKIRQKKSVFPIYKKMEAATGFEPVVEVLQTCALPLGYAALLWSGRRGSNSRPPPWQGGVLPLNYFR